MGQTFTSAYSLGPSGLHAGSPSPHSRHGLRVKSIQRGRLLHLLSSYAFCSVRLAEHPHKSLAPDSVARFKTLSEGVQRTCL